MVSMTRSAGSVTAAQASVDSSDFRHFEIRFVDAPGLVQIPNHDAHDLEQIGPADQMGIDPEAHRAQAEQHDAQRLNVFVRHGGDVVGTLIDQRVQSSRRRTRLRTIDHATARIAARAAG